MSPEINGQVACGFEKVRDQFAANFERDDAYCEVGASFMVYCNGTPVVDLWGGWRDEARTVPWTADTLVNIWSSTKGVTAIAVARLADQGHLDFRAPVARYWPEFAQNGKDAITVSQLMSHQAGLPGFTAATTISDFYDWETVTSRLAAQAPMWEPGTKSSYHAMTFGFLAGELIRRVSGVSVGQYVGQEIAGPLGADIFIGLPAAEEHRVAPLIPSPLVAASEAERPLEVQAAVTNPPLKQTLPNNRSWRAAEIPAGNGHASARGLALLYAAIAGGGSYNGVQLMSPAGVEAMMAVQTEGVDVMMGYAPLWGNGVMRNPARAQGGLTHVFGHPGWGGSFGCADLEANVAMAYVLNRLGDSGPPGDRRPAELCEAAYACL